MRGQRSAFCSFAWLSRRPRGFQPCSEPKYLYTISVNVCGTRDTAGLQIHMYVSFRYICKTNQHTWQTLERKTLSLCQPASFNAPAHAPDTSQDTPDTMRYTLYPIDQLALSITAHLSVFLVKLGTHTSCLFLYVETLIVPLTHSLLTLPFSGEIFGHFAVSYGLRPQSKYFVSNKNIDRVKSLCSFLYAAFPGTSFKTVCHGQ